MAVDPSMGLSRMFSFTMAARVSHQSGGRSVGVGRFVPSHPQPILSLV